MKAYLFRILELSNDLQTVGKFILFNDESSLSFECYTLEPPDKDNQKNISSIPRGKYLVDLQDSPKYGAETFTINDVPDRTNILIHEGNFKTDTKGCVVVGEELADINKDGLIDVTNSIKTLNKLKAKTDRFELQILHVCKLSSLNNLNKLKG